MARLIKADGTEEQRRPAAGSKWTLEELQAAVGGYIELMPGVRPMRMILDEEGNLKEKPVNHLATMLVRGQLAKVGQPLRYVPVIRGDVLLLDKGERM